MVEKLDSEVGNGNGLPKVGLTRLQKRQGADIVVNAKRSDGHRKDRRRCRGRMPNANKSARLP